MEATESRDGRYLYYHKGGAAWRMPLPDGEEERVLDKVEWGYWIPLEQGIWFLDRSAAPAALGLFHFASRQVKRIATVDLGPRVPGAPGFAVSPDGRFTLYNRIDQIDSEIMLAENFR
jgi:hypothetical protein